MKRLMALLFAPALLLQSATLSEVYELYANKQYAQACLSGAELLSAYAKDEAFVTMYGYACAESDYIDRLALPITLLKHTPEGRANATYFSVILLQKKLLYQAMLDGTTLEFIQIPSTNNVLSKVFDLYAQDPNAGKRTRYSYRDANQPERSYLLYVVYDDGVNKMVIETFDNDQLIDRHLYW